MPKNDSNRCARYQGRIGARLVIKRKSSRKKARPTFFRPLTVNIYMRTHVYTNARKIEKYKRGTQRGYAFSVISLQKPLCTSNFRRMRNDRLRMRGNTGFIFKVSRPPVFLSVPLFLTRWRGLENCNSPGVRSNAILSGFPVNKCPAAIRARARGVHDLHFDKN